MKTSTVLAVPAILSVLTAALLVTGCGGLSEGDQKALVLEYKRLGEAAEIAIANQHPDDEQKRSEEFRAAIDRIEKEVFAKYGVTKEEGAEIFREARRKGWW